MLFIKIKCIEISILTSQRDRLERILLKSLLILFYVHYYFKVNIVLGSGYMYIYVQISLNSIDVFCYVFSLF